MDLAFPAAELGLPDALSTTFFQMQTDQSESRRQLNLNKILALTEFTGTPETGETWLTENLNRLVYNESKRIYILPPQ
jgi:hypothetical protein